MNHGPFVRLTVGETPAAAAHSIYLRSFDVARVRKDPNHRKTAVQLYGSDTVYVSETPEEVVALIQATEGPERLRWRGPLGVEG